MSMTSDEYRELTREFLKNGSGSKQNLKEQFDFETEDMPRRENHEQTVDKLSLKDIDNGKTILTSVTVENDMITIEFGNSMTLHLDVLDAYDLADILSNAADELRIRKG